MCLNSSLPIEHLANEDTVGEAEVSKGDMVRSSIRGPTKELAEYCKGLMIYLE